MVTGANQVGSTSGYNIYYDPRRTKQQVAIGDEEIMFQHNADQQVAHASSNAADEPVAIYNSDGTSYVINGNMLREYDASNKLISERELSAEEKATSPSVVLKNLSNSRTSKNAEALPAKTNPDVPELSTEHNLNNGNVEGSYSFVENENGGTDLSFNLKVGDTFDSKAAQAFQKGLKESLDQGFSTGKYSFRGVEYPSREALMRDVESMKHKLAINSAIYEDLSARQKAGETLTSAEQKYMDSFKDSLSDLGLQISDNGEYTDLTIADTKGKKEDLAQVQGGENQQKTDDKSFADFLGINLSDETKEYLQNDEQFQQIEAEIFDTYASMAEAREQMEASQKAVDEAVAKYDKAITPAAKEKAEQELAKAKNELNAQKDNYDSIDKEFSTKFREAAIYAKSIETWQDGKSVAYEKSVSINGNLRSVRQEYVATTLPNGQKAYECDGKYYALDAKGYPDFKNIIEV